MTNIVPIRAITLPARRRDEQDWRIAYWAAKRAEQKRLEAIYGPEQ